MKQPNLNDLVIDRIGTRTTRKRLKKARTIKITIHIDQDTLVRLQKKSWQSRVSYQPLLNQVLIAGLRHKTQAESRLDRIEKELKKLKRRIAA
jgi:ABC-type Fe2+-enterobactin transport system substrate-binding protein